MTREVYSRDPRLNIPEDAEGRRGRVVRGDASGGWLSKAGKEGVEKADIFIQTRHARHFAICMGAGVMLVS